MNINFPGAGLDVMIKESINVMEIVLKAIVICIYFVDRQSREEDGVVVSFDDVILLQTADLE